MPKAKLFFAILLLAGALAFLALRLLPLAGIEARLGAELARELDGRVEIGALSWRWLPLPQLKLQQVVAASARFEFSAPQVLLYPDWHALFDRRIKLGKVVLHEPRLTLRAGPAAAAGSLPTLPALRVVIENGALRWQTAAGATLLLPAAGQLSGVAGSLVVGPGEVSGQLRAAAPFAPRLTAAGSFDLARGEYRLELQGRDCNLAQLFPPLLNERVKFSPRPLSWQAKIGGSGARYKLSVTGQVPTFDLADGSRLAASAWGGLEIERTDESFALQVKELVLTDPALTLSGQISRLAPLTPDGPPLWDLDFSARQLDLAAIREKVLTLWGEEPLAREVCAIVLGGRATKADYSFHGPLADLAHLGAQKIAVEVEKAPIHIPGINLDLDEASGPITIIDGALAGHGLTARIKESRGWNGELFLHLPSDGDAFHLALDLDVALPDLSAALRQVVHHPGFQRELRHFQEFTGRAQGHLLLGETLSALKSNVSVQAMSGQGRYDRLPWPVTVRGGSLEVAPKRVSWKNIQAEFEGQLIEESSGSVSWQGRPELNVEQLRGELDIAPLYRFGSLQLDNELFTLAEFLDNRLPELDGRLRLDRFQLRGPAAEPGAWQYRAEFKARELHWRTPRLPEAVVAESLSGSLDQGAAELAGTFHFQEQPLELKGSYRHRLLRDWRGWTEVSGTVEDKLAATVRGWELVPDRFFPRIPCTLARLRLETDGAGSGMGVSGRIVAGQGGAEAPAVEISANSGVRHDLRLSFVAGDEAGELQLRRPAADPAQILASWKGALRAETVNALFAGSPMLSGRLTGDASLSYREGEAESAVYAGFLAGEELRWEQGAEELPLRIARFRLSGVERQLRIGELLLLLGEEELAAQGTVGLGGAGVALDLALRSPRLDSATVARFFRTVRERVRQAEGGGAEGRSEEFWQRFGGRLRLELGELRHTQERKRAKAGEEATVTYSWSPFVGEVKLPGPEQIAFHLDHAAICGLAMSGNWYSAPELGVSNFDFATPGARPLFENTLPCLGVRQHLIAGEFDLAANFRGEVGNWREGSLHLRSPKGKIWRMELLSKVLSLVNITELFSLEGLPNLVSKGLAYTDLELQSHVEANRLLIDKGVLKGEGLNLTGQGEIELGDLQADLTIFIAPFKTIDSIVGKLPLLNKVVGGKKGAILTIPVGVKGPLADPELTILPPAAVGRSALELLKETLILPYTLVAPLLPNP